MTLAVTYAKRAERGETSNAVVTVETGSTVSFDGQGRVVLREAPSGRTLKLDPLHVIEIEESAGGEWL